MYLGGETVVGWVLLLKLSPLLMKPEALVVCVWLAAVMALVELLLLALEVLLVVVVDKFAFWTFVTT